MPSDFIQYLIDNKFLSKEKFSELQEESEKEGRSIEDLIIEKGIIPEQDFFREKSNFYKIPLRRVIPEDIPTSTLEEISEEAARHYKLIPLKREDHLLEVGMINPEDFSSQSALNFIAKQKGIEVKVYLILPSEFNEVLKKYRTLKEEVKTAIEELEKKEEGEGEKRRRPTSVVERVIEEAPISKIVAVILRHAIEGRASDVHIEPFKDRLRVRFRVDGVLYSSLFLDKKLLPSVVSRIKIMSDLRIDETRIPQDGRFHAVIANRKIDFRVATFPTSQGEKVAIRVLDPETGIKTLSELGLYGKNFEILEKASKLPYGSLIFCGPTGCGKTTTQYAILRQLNTESVNILSLEDPVEYWIDGVNQSQVRPEIGYTFATGLRQIVRQDPDIIMVGEVRDRETADLVTHAALTGHLVLFTLHTNNAVGAIPRLIDLGVEKFLIPTTVKVIVSQRLVRRLCPDCKEKVRANKEEEKIIREEIEKLSEEERKKIKIPSSLYIYKPKGCPHCNNKGTKGRIGIFEILTVTRALEKVILEEASEAEIEKEAQRQGMITLRQDGIIKVLQGETFLEEVLKETEIREEI
ncbi:MAG TPA: GspE/PulE family protein [Candidatus Pacearchaeota archaeon]|nr:GspE/PulE family protein [Candidatus Pacearchaeota archaeon]HOK94289.1 GspE/PulE family protein [Candidatus Pacearchaeota archaeon]HPO75435.1 GspE/PulE family protein [Candidatus Pacearchaeota archaeon]